MGDGLWHCYTNIMQLPLVMLIRKAAIYRRTVQDPDSVHAVCKENSFGPSKSPRFTFCFHAEPEYRLVGGLEQDFYFSIQLGVSSSQLSYTFIFFRGVGLNHQPVDDVKLVWGLAVFLQDLGWNHLRSVATSRCWMALSRWSLTLDFPFNWLV